MRTKAAAFVAAAALIGALIPIPTAGAAPADWEVGIGAYLNGQGLRQVSMRFFPDTLTVLQGDVIHFSSDGHHTATLLAPGVDSADWRSEYAAAQGDDYSMIVADPDEGTRALKMNQAAVSPSSTSCGVEVAPCVFGSSYTSDTPQKVLNSGLGATGGVDFHVQVDQPAGSSFKVISLMNPAMELTVSVGATQSDLSTPATIAANVAAQLNSDATEAAALHSTWKAKKPTKTVNKKTQAVTWGVWPGVDTIDAEPGAGGIALRYMYPAKVTLRKNQFVQWNFKQLAHVAQTITFPATRAATMAANFRSVVCDPDTDAGLEPDYAPTESEFPYCDSPLHIEMDISPEVVKKAGDTAYTGGSDFQHSGLRGANLATSNGPYKLKFTKTSPVKKPFKLASATHPFMTQTLVVKI